MLEPFRQQLGTAWRRTIARTGTHLQRLRAALGDRLHRHRSAIEAGALLAVLSLVTAGTAWTSWQNLEGRSSMRAEISDPAQTHDITAPVQRPRPAPPGRVDDEPAARSPAAERSASTQVRGGSGLALAVVAGVLGAGGIAALAVVRRYRGKIPDSGVEEPEDHPATSSRSSGETDHTEPQEVDPVLWSRSQVLEPGPDSPEMRSAESGDGRSAGAGEDEAPGDGGPPGPPGVAPEAPYDAPRHPVDSPRSVRGATGAPDGTRMIVDRRASQRVSYSQRATLRWQGVEATAMTVDLSAAGVRLAVEHAAMTTRPAPTQTEVVTVVLPLGGQVLTLTARVVRVQTVASGIDLGLLFEEVPDAVTQRLKATILRVQLWGDEPL